MRNYKKEYENYHSRPEQKIRRAARNAARKRFSNADPTLDVHHKDNDPLNNDLNNLSLVTQHYNRKEPRLREKKLKDLKSKLTAALRQTESNLKEEMIDDFEIRFGNESDWKKADKLVQDYLRKDVPKHAKALFKKTYVHGPDPLMVQFGDTKKKLKPPVNLNKLYNAIRYGLKSARDKYWDSIDKKLEPTAVGEGVDGDAMIDLMQKYLLTKNKSEKKNLLKQINRYQKKLGLKVTEDMGSTTGAHIAGTGDDNTVHTKPKKKVKRRISLIKGMAKKR